MEERLPRAQLRQHRQQGGFRHRWRLVVVHVVVHGRHPDAVPVGGAQAPGLRLRLLAEVARGGGCDVVLDTRQVTSSDDEDGPAGAPHPPRRGAPGAPRQAPARSRAGACRRSGSVSGGLRLSAAHGVSQ
ncbi:hypothetical protein NUM3379_08130 [Kineococcus sp. NUM-3379]